MWILHARTCSPQKCSLCRGLGPPRRALTCRVKSEDLRGKQAASILSAVFNFLALSVVHGHNSRAEIAFPGCSARARKHGVIMRCHTLQREQIKVARLSRRPSLGHRRTPQVH